MRFRSGSIRSSKTCTGKKQRTCWKSTSFSTKQPWKNARLQPTNGGSKLPRSQAPASRSLSSHPSQRLNLVSLAVVRVVQTRVLTKDNQAILPTSTLKMYAMQQQQKAAKPLYPHTTIYLSGHGASTPGLITINCMRYKNHLKKKKSKRCLDKITSEITATESISSVLKSSSFLFH